MYRNRHCSPGDYSACVPVSFGNVESMDRQNISYHNVSWYQVFVALLIHWSPIDVQAEAPIELSVD